MRSALIFSLASAACFALLGGEAGAFALPAWRGCQHERGVALGHAATLAGPRQLQSAGAACAACAAALALAAARAGSAAAAGAVGGGRRHAIRRRAFENSLGVQPPLGYFDPLGISADGDPEEFYRRRESEIKHGRVSMYATIGYIAAEWFRWPGFLSPSQDLSFEDMPNGLAAIEKVPVEGWLQILAYIGFYELCVNFPQNPAEPGNYYKGRFAVFWQRIMSDRDQRNRSLNAELANGRLAMVAIMGMMFQNGVTGTTGPAMWFPRF